MTDCELVLAWLNLRDTASYNNFKLMILNDVIHISKPGYSYKTTSIERAIGFLDGYEYQIRKQSQV